MYQFQRDYVLTLYDRDNGKLFTITELRLSFDIQQNVDHANKNNSAEVKVYNLAQTTLDKFSDKQMALSATLAVGYVGSIQQLLKGDVVQIMTKKVGVDTETTFKIADGFKILNGTKVHKTYPEGVTIGFVIQNIAENNNLEVDVIATGNTDRTLPYGYPATGTLKQILDDLCKPNDLEWSILEGKLTVKDKRSVSPNKNVETAIVLSQESGLLDIPYTHTEEVTQAIEQPLEDNETDITEELKPTKSGKPRKQTRRKIQRSNIELKALLNPSVKPNSLIRLDSTKTKLSGYYRVRTIKYSGDTRGGEWFMQIWGDNVKDLV